MVFGRHRILIYVFVSFVVIFTTVAIAILFPVGFSVLFISSIVSFVVLSSAMTPMMNRSRKGIIILEDSGLTLNGDIKMGPIPWECICGASIARILFDRILTIYVTDILRLEAALGKDVVYKNVGKNGKTGERSIRMCIDLCRLHGVDLEALIMTHAKGLPRNNSQDGRNPA